MRNVLLCSLSILLVAITCSAKPVHHYVFFGMDREKLKDATAFLEMKIFEGAQIAYSWRQLEPRKDEYDFSLIRDDLAFLSSKGKKLFVQIQDVSFNESLYAFRVTFSKIHSMVEVRISNTGIN